MAQDEEVAHHPRERHHAVWEGVLVDVIRVMPEPEVPFGDGGVLMLGWKGSGFRQTGDERLEYLDCTRSILLLSVQIRGHQRRQNIAINPTVPHCTPPNSQQGTRFYFGNTYWVLQGRLNVNKETKSLSY